MENCNCQYCMRDYQPICGLCNRNAEEIIENGDETCFDSNTNSLAESASLEDCHCYFCAGCRYWMHKNNINNCRRCDRDITELIMRLSCPYDIDDKYRCVCNDSDTEIDSESENLT